MIFDSRREACVCGVLFGIWLGYVVAEGVWLVLEQHGHTLRTAWCDGRQTGREILEANKS